jgi:hypothetical protein
VQPLPRHGHQLAVAAEAQVGAELERPAQERARFGAVGEIQHLRHIGRAEHHHLGISDGGQVITGHLHTLAESRDLPASRRLDGSAGQQEQAATGTHQASTVRPVRLGRLIRQGEERADVHGVTQNVAAALGKPGMRPSQR